MLAIVGGFLQIPGVTGELHHFLEPTFADSELYEDARADGDRRSGSGWRSAPLIGLAGIGIAWRIYGHGGNAGRDPGAVLGALHKFFVNKWYFDEAINFLIVRPTAWLGRFANSTVERVFVNGALIGGSTGAVRDAVGGRARAPVRLPALLRRAAADRLHRPGAYFLISA